ncbi:MAG: hypothetical protein GXO42_01510 [bacterium]|nr:hypothetical protein [bacterium]
MDERQQVYELLKQLQACQNADEYRQFAEDLEVLQKYCSSPDLKFLCFLLRAVLLLLRPETAKLRQLLEQLIDFYVNEDYGSILVLLKEFVARE